MTTTSTTPPPADALTVTRAVTDRRSAGVAPTVLTGLLGWSKTRVRDALLAARDHQLLTLEPNGLWTSPAQAVTPATKTVKKQTAGTVPARLQAEPRPDATKPTPPPAPAPRNTPDPAPPAAARARTSMARPARASQHRGAEHPARAALVETARTRPHLTNAELARQYAVSNVTAAKWRRDAGLAAPRGGRPWAPARRTEHNARVAEGVRLYLTGLSQTEAARRAPCGERQLRDALQAKGLARVYTASPRSVTSRWVLARTDPATCSLLLLAGDALACPTAVDAEAHRARTSRPDQWTVCELLVPTALAQQAAA